MAFAKVPDSITTKDEASQRVVGGCASLKRF